MVSRAIGDYSLLVFGRLADPAKRFLWLRRSGLFQDGLFAGGGRGNGRRGFRGVGSCGSGDGRSAFGEGLFQETFGDLLGAARVVVGLFRFAVFVDGAFALAEHVKNLSEVDMAPDFRPFFGWLRNGLQRFAERVRCRLIVFLVEEGLAHAEIGQRPVRLNRKGPLVLRHRIVKAALFGEIFAPRNGRAGTQRSAPFQNDIVGIDLDAARLRPAKGLDGEPRFRSDHVDGFLLRLSFRIYSQIHRHAKGVQRLLDLANDAKTLWRPVHDVFQRELRHAR